jgi:hypothetical protein
MTRERCFASRDSVRVVILVLMVALSGASAGTGAAAVAPDADGYVLAAADGGVFAFGRPFLGSAAVVPLNAPVVGIASTPDGGGYWLAAADGGVFTFGNAPFLGSLAGVRLNGPVVGIAAAPDGRGYWLVAADGGVFAFGSARFLGSAVGAPLGSAVVGITPTEAGNGYSVLTRDGQIYEFGDARAPAQRTPVKLPDRPAGYVGLAHVPGTRHGLWVVAADGAQVLVDLPTEPPPGACGPIPGVLPPLQAPVVGIAASGPFDSCARWLAAADGGVFAHSAPFLGSMGGVPLVAPVVGIAAS